MQLKKILQYQQYQHTHLMTNMETLFIGYPPCSTCKKAYKALQDLGIEATFRNIKEDNPTYEVFQSLEKSSRQKKNILHSEDGV